MLNNFQNLDTVPVAWGSKVESNVVPAFKELSVLIEEIGTEMSALEDMVLGVLGSIFTEDLTQTG